MEFGRQRGFLLDGEDPPEKVGCRKELRVIFWSSCMLMLPGILLELFSMSFLMVPRAPITTGTVVVLSPDFLSTSISKSLYLVGFSVVLTEVLGYGQVSEKAGFILFFSTMSGLLAAMVVSVWLSMSDRIMALSFSVQLTFLGSCLYYRSFTSMPKALQIFQCMCAAALLWRWIYSVLASSGQPETRWAMVSSKRPHSLHLGSTSGFLRMSFWYQSVGRL